ncbi:MAG TPA: alpha/beta hydrolase, partial [Ardenticatenaceae bacterium]|nr:alpha/beta hydrolase [Ardenticatenaceae bacterium]
PPSTRPVRPSRVGRFVFALLVLLALVMGCGTIYEAVARWRELRAVTEPGQLVDVGGYRLHIVCQGERAPGAPAVILDAGVGGWSAHWSTFQRRVAEFARVCSYDRAGMGWSDAGPQPRDGRRVVAELHALLAGAGESPPYLLVGASRGGQYARLYRDAYPAEVSGLVLVDPEPEEMRSRSAMVRNLASQNPVLYSVLRTLRGVGFLRLLMRDPTATPTLPCLPSIVGTLPAEERAAYLAVEGQAKCFDSVLAEEAATNAREEQLRQAAPLGDLPMIVLVRGVSVADAETEGIWRELQQELAGLSTRGTLVQAASSGHEIARDQPELVIDAIRQLLETP